MFAFARCRLGIHPLPHQCVEFGSEIADFVTLWNQNLGDRARVTAAAANGLVQVEQRPEQGSHGEPDERRKQQGQNHHELNDLLLSFGKRCIRLLDRKHGHQHPRYALQ